MQNWTFIYIVNENYELHKNIQKENEMRSIANDSVRTSISTNKCGEYHRKTRRRDLFLIFLQILGEVALIYGMFVLMALIVLIF